MTASALPGLALLPSALAVPLIVELAGRTPGAEATEGQGSSA